MSQALSCAWGMSEWRSFTARVGALTESQRIDNYSEVLAQHVDAPSDFTSLQLAYLQIRMDPALTSLHHALNLLEQIDTDAELGALAEALRREIALLAALTHQYEGGEHPQAPRATDEKAEIQQLRKQLSSLYEQLNKSLQQLETLKSIESEMVPGARQEVEP